MISEFCVEQVFGHLFVFRGGREKIQRRGAEGILTPPQPSPQARREQVLDHRKGKKVIGERFNAEAQRSGDTEFFGDVADAGQLFNRARFFIGFANVL